MTLQEAKDETAKKYGFTKWEYYLANSQYFDMAVIDDYFQKIVDLYCQSQKAKAWEEGYHEMNEVAKQIMIGIVPERPSNPYKP